MKEHGYRFSGTEKLWIKEVRDADREAEEEWVGEITGANNIRIVSAAENTIDSVYFGIVGKKLAPAFNEELKRLGFKFDRLRGWYKRIPAAEKSDFSNLCETKFYVSPKFTGTL